MSSVKYYSCNCFLSKNFFIEKFKVHVIYDGENHLSNDIKQLLKLHNASEKDLEEILVILQTERKRRQNLGSESFHRKMVIKQKYSPLHPHLFSLQESFFQPEFIKIYEYASSVSANCNGLLERIEPTNSKYVWRFPVFTHKFCDEFIEELDHFQCSDLPKGRPNTMNNYGILLNELGFDESFLDVFRVKYLSPIAKILLPDWYGDNLDSHKAFTVSYKENKDLCLSCHFDNAEISVNISLGKNFEDGDLYFGGMNTDPPVNLLNMTRVKHVKGHAVLHRGQHMHGAMPISGENAERHNIIIWMRSSSVRNKRCPMCGQQPVLFEQPYGGDGFSNKGNCNVL